MEAPSALLDPGIHSEVKMKALDHRGREPLFYIRQLWPLGDGTTWRSHP